MTSTRPAATAAAALASLLQYLDDELAELEAMPPQAVQAAAVAAGIDRVALTRAVVPGVVSSHRRQPAASFVRLAQEVGIDVRRDLAAHDLSDLQLAGEPFAHADLRAVDLSRSDLSEASLVQALLADAVLRQAKLRAADLSGADLTRSDLRDADLSNASLIGATVAGADFTGATLDGAKLAGVDLSRTTGVPDALMAPEGGLPASADLGDLLRRQLGGWWTNLVGPRASQTAEELVAERETTKDDADRGLVDLALALALWRLDRGPIAARLLAESERRFIAAGLPGAAAAPMILRAGLAGLAGDGIEVASALASLPGTPGERAPRLIAALALLVTDQSVEATRFLKA